MSLTVALTPSGYDPDASASRAVLVVDVLRAATTIATALANGARAVVPVAEKGEAGRLAAHLDRETTVLGGERGGEKLAGFALGNSPAEYAPDVVAGKTVVLTTTNGTSALVRAQGAARLAVGSLANATASVAFLRQAADDGLDLTILCAGWRGEVAIEDALCAGLLAERLGERTAGDGAQIARGLYAGSADDLGAALRRSAHARRLADLGADGDVAACGRVDALGVLPVFRDGQLVADAA